MSPTQESRRCTVLIPNEKSAGVKYTFGFGKDQEKKLTSYGSFQMIKNVGNCQTKKLNGAAQTSYRPPKIIGTFLKGYVTGVEKEKVEVSSSENLQSTDENARTDPDRKTIKNKMWLCRKSL